MRVLVLGMGNLLLRDEGVGVHAAHCLMKRSLPKNVTVMDVGTAILDALPLLEEVDRVVVIDAVQGGDSPGTIYRMPLDEFAPNPCIASMHGFDLSRVLAMTRRRSPPDILVIGVEPAEITWSMELSPLVGEALPEVMELVLEEIEGAVAQSHPMTE